MLNVVVGVMLEIKNKMAGVFSQDSKANEGRRFVVLDSTELASSPLSCFYFFPTSLQHTWETD